LKKEYKAMAVNYEWDVETIDPQSGDIMDHDHADTLKELKRYFSDPGFNISLHLVLVRDDWDPNDGELLVRTHWYPHHDSEPEFANGMDVPKRFIKEFKSLT
jgi:hypothetical protein